MFNIKTYPEAGLTRYEEEWSPVTQCDLEGVKACSTESIPASDQFNFSAAGLLH